LKLTDEQLEYQKLSREFAQREIAPLAASTDHSAVIPESLIEKIKELGLLNVRIPDKWGGLGLTNLDAAIIAEEFSAGCPGIASIIIASELAITPALLIGSDALQDRVLGYMANNAGFLGCAPVDELGSSEVIATAGKNEYSFSGQVRLMQNLNRAQYYFVIARLSSMLSSSGRSAPDLIATYLPRESVGLSIKPIEKPLGLRAADIGTLELKNVIVTVDQIIRLNDRPTIFHDIASCNHAISAAAAVGLASSALSLATAYSKERKTFGVEIAQHQGVSFMLADMDKEIESARLLVWRAAKCADARAFDEALSLSAKAHAQTMAMQVTTDAVQVYGGYGYSKEYPVEKLMRDAKALDVYNGTAQVHFAELGKQLLQTH